MSSLFHVATKRAMRTARREWHRSTPGKLLGEATKAATSARGLTHRIQSQVDRAKRVSGLGELEKLEQMGIEHYAKGFGEMLIDKAREEALNAFFSSLGPLGSIIRAIVQGKKKGSKLARDINAATRWLQSLGYEVLPPRGQRKGPAAKRGRRAATEFLDDIAAIHNKPVAGGGKGAPNTHQQRNKVELAERNKPEAGQPMRILKKNPQRKIQLKKIRGSSNVYAVGYDEPTNSMFVTYLGGDSGHRHGQGTTYGYYHVPPEIYIKILTAGSVGSAIWEHLRSGSSSQHRSGTAPKLGRSSGRPKKGFKTSGTAFGHQFPYEIVHLGPGNYVPRQATHAGLAPRTVRSKRGNVHRSSLIGTGVFTGPRGGARSARQVQRGRPYTASPNRGVPNRGRA